jgi:cellulose synthase/poly-beta-1,6-N-acetylglucosamine synthase-like glycosyltransferase
MSAPELLVSVVVIGRNEGERLHRCLESLAKARWVHEGRPIAHEVIYVDSNSSDDSVARAEKAGARVLGLGQQRPCAAAGRNIGWRAAKAPFILFLDGDTVLHPDFVGHALESLRAPELVAAWGHRRELFPEQSVYTRVLDLDWVFAPGRVSYFGGDVLVRRQALQDVGGFDDQQVAGEEPELCRRLRERGWQIEHLDVPMTGHDLALTTVQAYWKRAERAGLAYAQVAERFAQTPDPLWLAESRRNRVHGTAVLAAGPLGLLLAWFWPLAGAAAFVLGLLFWARSAWRCRWKCPGEPGLALLYALHSHLQQVPILAGQLKYERLRRRREAPRLMEYKGPHAGPGEAP